MSRRHHRRLRAEARLAQWPGGKVVVVDAPLEEADLSWALHRRANSEGRCPDCAAVPVPEPDPEGCTCGSPHLTFWHGEGCRVQLNPPRPAA